MEKETKRRIKITILGIIGVIILLIGVSFAAFSTDLAGTKVQGIQSGCLKVEMTDNGAVNMTNEAPVKDEDGLNKTPYTYTLKNTCTTDAFYTATINVMNTSNLDNVSKIKVALDGDSYLAPTIESNLEEMESVDSSETGISKTYKLDDGYLKKGEEKTFNLRTWIDYDVTSITGKIENKVIVLSEAREGQAIEYNTNTSGYDVLKENTVLTNVDYSQVPTESGIVRVEEDNNVKYYFRGNPNNNMTFAGLDFKVLSTNNDGSVNIVLNNTIDSSTYENIETTLLNWYDINIKENEKYIKTDQTYCEEKTNSNGEYLGRLRVENHNPSINCSTLNKYTKVGILTADDLMYAGGVKGISNTSFYLNSTNSYFLSTFKDASTIYAYKNEDSISEVKSNIANYLKPVITIKSNVMIKGKGTTEEPFYIGGLYGEELDTSDKVAPEIVDVSVDARWSKDDKTIKITGKDNFGGSGIGGYIVKSSNTKPDINDSTWEATSSTKYETVNKYDNGTYYVFVKDNAGNVSEGKEIVINKVDKVAPSCTIRINPNGSKAAYKTLSIMTEEKNIDLKGYSWDHTDSTEDVVKVTKNGVYTGYITDLAGNQGSCSGTVITIEPPVSAVEKILEKVGTDGIVAEEHPATEQLGAVTDYRYTGANPNNYVRFNNELWRIIGVFPTDDGTGNIENRVKIIRDELIGNYSWDNKPSGTGSSISNYGSNDWSDSALQIVLNEGAYYNRTTGNCPYGKNGATTACDFTSTGLTEEAKSMISDAKWYLGGPNSSLNASNGLTSHYYSYERGTTVYSGRPVYFIGKVGIIYPSDYGYATSGGSTISREECLEKELHNWHLSSYSDCNSNNWLYTNYSYWTITQYAGDSWDVLYFNSNGYIRNNSADGSTEFIIGEVIPVLYLSSTVQISGGTGTESDPYILTKDVQLITFTINGKTYTAEAGMTWGEWIASEYNTDEFYWSEDGLLLTGETVKDGQFYLYVSGALSNIEIIADNKYSLVF